MLLNKSEYRPENWLENKIKKVESHVGTRGENGLIALWVQINRMQINGTAWYNCAQHSRKTTTFKAPMLPEENL